MTVTPEATYSESWLWITLEITSRLVYYQATVSHSAEMLGPSLELCFVTVMQYGNIFAIINYDDKHDDDFLSPN